MMLLMLMLDEDLQTFMFLPDLHTAKLNESMETLAHELYHRKML
jgi:hypothetical protein